MSRRTRSVYSRGEPQSDLPAAYDHRAASRLSGTPLDTEYIDKRLTSLQAAYAPSGVQNLGSPFHSRGPSPLPGRPRSTISHYTELHPHDSASVAAFKAPRSGGTDRDGHLRSRSATPSPGRPYVPSHHSRSGSPHRPVSQQGVLSPQPLPSVLPMSGMLSAGPRAPDVDGQPRPPSRTLSPLAPPVRSSSAEPPHTVLSAAFSRPGAALQDLESMTTIGTEEWSEGVAGAYPATMGEHREQLLREQRLRAEEDARRVEAHDAHLAAQIQATHDAGHEHQLALAYDLADAVARLREAQEQLLVAQVRNSQYEMKVAQVDGEKNKYKADLAVVASLLRRTRDDGKKSDEERRRLLRAFEETRLRLFKYHEEIKVRDARSAGREEGRQEAFEEAERWMDNKGGAAAPAGAAAPLTNEQLAAHYFSLSPYGGGTALQPALGVQQGFNPTLAQQFQQQVQSMNGQQAMPAGQVPVAMPQIPQGVSQMAQPVPQFQQFAVPPPAPAVAKEPATANPTLLDMADDMARLAATAQELAAARSHTPAPITPQVYPTTAPSLPAPTLPRVEAHHVPLPPSMTTAASALGVGSGVPFPRAPSGLKARPQSMIVGQAPSGLGLGLRAPLGGSRAPSRASDLNKPLPLPGRPRSRSVTAPVHPHAAHARSSSHPEPTPDECMLHAHIHQSRSNSQVDRYPVFIPSQPIAVSAAGSRAPTRPPTAHAHTDSLNTLKAAAATGLPPSRTGSYVSRAPTVRSQQARSYLREVMRTSDEDIDDGHLSRINEEPSPMPRVMPVVVPPSVPPPPRVPRSMASPHSHSTRSRRVTTVPSHLSYGGRSGRTRTETQSTADPNLTAIGLGLNLHGSRGPSQLGTRHYDVASSRSAQGVSEIRASPSPLPSRAPSRATRVSNVTSHTRSHSYPAAMSVHDDVRRAAAVPVPPSEPATYATKTAYGYDRPSAPPAAPRSTRSTRTVDVAAAHALPASRAPSAYGVTVETVLDAEAPSIARSPRRSAPPRIATPAVGGASPRHLSPLPPSPARSHSSHRSGHSGHSGGSAASPRSTRSHHAHAPPSRPHSRSRFPTDTDDDLDPYPPSSRPRSRLERERDSEPRERAHAHDAARHIPLPPPGAGSAKTAY